MIRRPPRSTRTDTLFPYTTLFRSGAAPRYALQTAGSAAKCPLHFGQIRLPGCALRKISPQPPKHGRSRTTATGVDSASDHFSMTRSEEHTSELQSLMRISYAVFCLKKKKYNPQD